MNAISAPLVYAEAIPEQSSRPVMALDSLCAPAESRLERLLKLGFICGLHALLLALLASAGLAPQAVENLLRLDVRVIEDTPPKLQQEKPRPLPPALRPAATPSVEQATPAPVMTSAAETPAAPGRFTVPSQPTVQRPEPLPVEAPPAPAPAAPLPPVVGARFDADYLHNPAPSYPSAARRKGDQGKVLVRVLVSVQGLASAVQLQTSSGYPRLDEAALETVRQWRFVPARRGTQPVEDWVLVPIVFRLDS